MELEDEELLKRKEQINKKITLILKNMNQAFPEIQGLNAVLKNGETISYSLLASLLSLRYGIFGSAGMAAGAAIVGSAGMAAAIGGILPIAIIGIGVYGSLGKIKKNQKINTLNNSYQQCLELQVELLQEKEKFEEELKVISIMRNTLDTLKKEFIE